MTTPTPTSCCNPDFEPGSTACKNKNKNNDDSESHILCHACNDTSVVHGAVWGQKGSAKVCVGPQPNAGDIKKVLSYPNTTKSPCKSNNCPAMDNTVNAVNNAETNYGHTGFWACKPPDWETDTKKGAYLGKYVQPSTGNNFIKYTKCSPDPLPIDATYPAMSCTHTGPMLLPDGGTGYMSQDYAVWSKNGGFGSNADSTGTCTATSGKGGWCMDQNTYGSLTDGASDAIVDTDPNPVPSDWTYMYIQPGNETCRKKAADAGMGVPYGCQLVKANIAKPLEGQCSKESFRAYPTNESFTYIQDAGDGKTSTSTSQAGVCTDAIKSQLKSTCEGVQSDSSVTKGSMCEKINEDIQNAKAKVQALKNQAPWYDKINPKATLDGVADIVNAFGHASNESKQMIANAMNLNININQTSQAQEICENNARSIQANTFDVTSCPNPYPDLIDEICPPQLPVPCTNLCEERDSTNTCKPKGPGCKQTQDEKTQEIQNYKMLNQIRNNCIYNPNYMKQSNAYTAAAADFIKNSKPLEGTYEQSATSQISQTCAQKISQLQNSNFAAGATNSIAQLLTQKDKNSSSSISDALTCNDMNANESACNYQSTSACCANTANVQQYNDVHIVAGCSPINLKIKQDLNSSVSQICTQGMDQTQVAKGTAQLSNKIKQAASQTATGLDPLSFLWIFVIIIGIILLSPILLVWVVGNKIILIIGIVLMLIGAAMLYPYFKYRYQNGCNKNSPFVFSTRADAPVLNTQSSITFKDAYEQYMNNENVNAFDFFPSCLKMEDYPSSIDSCNKISPGYQSFPVPVKGDGNKPWVFPDATPGMAVFYKSIAKSMQNGVTCTKFGGDNTPVPKGKKCTPDSTGSTGSCPQKDSNGLPQPVPYRVTLNETNPFKQSSDLPVPNDPTKNQVTAESCVQPSVSYYKGNDEKIILYGACGTGIVGIAMLIVGVIVSSGKKSSTVLTEDRKSNYAYKKYSSKK